MTNKKSEWECRPGCDHETEEEEEGEEVKLTDKERIVRLECVVDELIVEVARLKKWLLTHSKMRIKL